MEKKAFKVFIDIMTKALREEVTAMTQLTIEIPDALARRLAGLASEQNKSVEQVAVEQLASLLKPAAENLEGKYERFFQQSGLFVERLAEENQRYQAVSEERLKELAAKLGGAGPLSEVIVAERGRN
jgi:predicted transcriptional regulator